MPQIATLFANDINRQIEEVIKVDQTAEAVVASEVEEYVVTDAIKRHFVEVFERYQETPQKPHEGIAIWVSGFFGSGKSSFAKLLGLTIENRTVLGEPVSDRFLKRTHDAKLSVVLKTINEKIPTHTVIFDVSTDRGIRSGNQMLSQIMYRLFLASLGYSDDLDLSELEINLEQQGELETFKEVYRKETQREWDVGKNRTMFALNEASRTLHTMRPETFPLADSWVKANVNRADISPGKLADRIVQLMQRRKPGKSLMFVVDEVGQFVARDVQKMLDLQAVVQQLGVKGRGKHWIVVTSQEKLNELVSGLDDRNIELARLMDRFPLQVHLEPSDISEVTSRRVLSKNAGAEQSLGALFEANRGRLVQSTRIQSDIRLPEIDRQSFVDLYPLLPYQIELIIQIVSGLRTQSGGSRHVGGANRTIIKLAQQLLINPQTQLAAKEVGALVRLDHVYDLVDGNIASDIRAKIASIPSKVDHPKAQAVAKTVCLLQFVKSVRRSAENVAACLQETVSADSCLAEVKAALAELTKTSLVREADDGYRIPTPAEDDWSQNRFSISAHPADENKLYAEVLSGFWSPTPTFSLGDTKSFRAGLMFNGKEEVSGDITFNVQFADGPAGAAALSEQLRVRSQTDPKSIFWVVTLDEDIRSEVREAYRSQQMIERRSRDAATQDGTALVADEKGRLRRHMDELRRRLKAAALSGQVWFRGNDRSPDGGADVGKAAIAIVGVVLPLVYDRFGEASAKAADLKKGVDALFTVENLNGLPPVFGQLGLLRDEHGKPVFKIDVTPLAEIMAQITAKANYGEQATGKFLEDEFSKPPFGWDFEAVRLLALSLLRAGAVEAVSKGVTIDSVTSTQAKDAFSNNNLFRSTSFRPKKGVDMKVRIEAADNFKETFGEDVRELTTGAIAEAIRKAVEEPEDDLQKASTALRIGRFPGAEVLDNAIDQIKGIRRGFEENAITTFNASHRSIREAIKRATDLSSVLSEPALLDLDRAKTTLAREAPALLEEPDLDPAFREKVVVLGDRLSKETFFRDIAEIEQAATAVSGEYRRRYDEALDARVAAYAAAVATLEQTPGWERLDGEQQEEVARALRQCADRNWNNQTIAHIRSVTEACDGRLAAAVEKIHTILEGERVATVSVGKFFAGGIENDEQLEQALSGIRDEFSRLLGAGKIVIVR
ncbi:hypothetical protein DFR50_10197 [Roseiarcus fermentans]|uniref:BREX system P-loop protein BrxC n=1 Tax=Roseiarcus fermentans TaxID=1473586 RepID=A0A366FTZ2_9HYPH|nr:BREX system P-loop protein BrxC [Roseiarcus fermentans]RBP18153.1 hypothetical protein DFR50_10197 [Roseiarcus fermentans]